MAARTNEDFVLARYALERLLYRRAGQNHRGFHDVATPVELSEQQLVPGAGVEPATKGL